MVKQNGSLNSIFDALHQFLAAVLTDPAAADILHVETSTRLVEPFPAVDTITPNHVLHDVGQATRTGHPDCFFDNVDLETKYF